MVENEELNIKDRQFTKDILELEKRDAIILDFCIKNGKGKFIWIEYMHRK
jgi:hypothetical protein